MPRKIVASQRKNLQIDPEQGRPTRAELAKIHIAKRDLKLTDQLYRGVLNVLFGETSARDLSHKQIDELLDHFKSLGWGNEYRKEETTLPPHSNGRKVATMAQLGLIMYLWKHGPGIRNKSTQALDYFLNHHFHVSHLKEVKAGQVPEILAAIKNMGKV
ncbi:MAG: DUF1018 domain-containing protein [Nitrospina sp.]|nr:DUF1018 domain-containing protein [Nitrospina sp.]